MKTTTRRSLAGYLALVIPVGFILAFATTGCGNKDEKPQGSGDYYTGPMKSKAETGGTALSGQPQKQ